MRVLKTDNLPIPNLFGIGMGYSFKTADACVGAEKSYNTRADSFSLYLKQTGNKLLSSLLPHTFGIKTPNYSKAKGINLGTTTYYQTKPILSANEWSN